MKNTILIVEDDESLRNMYKFKLKHDKYLVETANDGEKGYEKAKEIQPDLILLDLRMPVMDGDEMLAKVRAQQWGSSIQVIILTNLSRREAPMSLGLLNVSRYIVKAHTTPAQVVKIIEEVFEAVERR